MELSDVLAQFDREHPQVGPVMLAVAYGHCSGYSSFLRVEPDYEALRAQIRSGDLDSLLEQPLSTRGPKPSRGLFEALVAFFERYG